MLVLGPIIGPGNRNTGEQPTSTPQNTTQPQQPGAAPEQAGSSPPEAAQSSQATAAGSPAPTAATQDASRTRSSERPGAAAADAVVLSRVSSASPNSASLDLEFARAAAEAYRQRAIVESQIERLAAPTDTPAIDILSPANADKPAEVLPAKLEVKV